MTDPAQPSMDESNRLALQRTHLAATRTLLALIRTGAVIAGGGALVTDLLIKEWPRWLVGAISTGFILIGYWLMWAAVKKAKQLRAFYGQSAGPEGPLFKHWHFLLITGGLQLLLAIVVVLYLVKH